MSFIFYAQIELPIEVNELKSIKKIKCVRPAIKDRLAVISSKVFLQQSYDALSSKSKLRYVLRFP